MLLLEDRRFYVYIYLDPRKSGEYIYNKYKFNYEPLYVGKGSHKRDISHLKFCKKYKSFFYNVLRKILNNNIKPIFFRIKDNLTEKEAFMLEIELISEIGMKKDKKGTLLNCHSGGCGETLSEETKKKISKKNKGKKVSEEIKKKISKSHMGIKNTEETKRKISAKNKGRKMSEETKNKIAISSTGRKHTKEYKEKMSKLLTGRKLSEETKKKIGEKSKLKSEESWKNTREARKNSILSDKGRESLSKHRIKMNKTENFREKLREASKKRDRDEKGHFISYKNKEKDK